ncbi:hypothetical protein D1AOALGA4SA_2721 [Olavius algarvensis Delta 1 endosymbiont]|nr:hypothetical protein D1AOALGA4SA_2721 [Olavius algarvensis Delta 1 endosymbiont]
MPGSVESAFRPVDPFSVQQLIKQLWAIEMHTRTVGDYMKMWGFTSQKPLRSDRVFTSDKNF